MNDFNNQPKCTKDTLLIRALYRWSDTEREARKAGQPLLAFFIALVIQEIRAILNAPHN